MDHSEKMTAPDMLPRLVNGRHRLMVPRHIAEWDAPTSWELARFADMERHLTLADTLYDVGVEHGWMSAIWAQWVGRIVLVEPTPEFWPNIRATFEANWLPPPAACWAGLLGRSGRIDLRRRYDRWPPASEGPATEAMAYRYLHNDGARTPRCTLDQLVEATGIVPTAVTVDVEGAELEVVAGAIQTLTEHRPMLWLSVHPDLMARDYGTEPEELFAVMGELDYHRDLLGIDHEEHHRFVPKERL